MHSTQHKICETFIYRYNNLNTYIFAVHRCVWILCFIADNMHVHAIAIDLAQTANMIVIRTRTCSHTHIQGRITQCSELIDLMKSK